MDLFARCILWCAFICYNVDAVNPEESSRRHRAEIDVAYAGLMEIGRWTGLALDADGRVDLKLFLVELQSMAEDGARGQMRRYVKDKVDVLMRNVTALARDATDPDRRIKGYPTMSEAEFGNIASMLLLMSHWFRHPMNAVEGIEAGLRAYNLKKAFANKRYDLAKEALMGLIEKVIGPLSRENDEGIRGRAMYDQDKDKDTVEDYLDEIDEEEIRPIDETDRDDAADLKRNNADEKKPGGVEPKESTSPEEYDEQEGIQADEPKISGEDEQNTDEQQQDDVVEEENVAEETQEAGSDPTSDELDKKKKRIEEPPLRRIERMSPEEQRRLRNIKKLENLLRRRLINAVRDKDGTGGVKRSREGYEGYGSKYFIDTLPKIPRLQDEGDYEMPSMTNRRSVQPTVIFGKEVLDPDAVASATEFEIEKKREPRILKKSDLNGYLDESQEIQEALVPVPFGGFNLDDLNIA